MTDNKQKYIQDLGNDELWAELPPQVQIDLCTEFRHHAEANLTAINAKLSDRELATTRAQRHEWTMKRVNTIRFIDRVDRRRQKAGQAQIEANILASNAQERVERDKLKEAVRAHYKVTHDPNSGEEAIAEADDVLYAVLFDVIGGEENV